MHHARARTLFSCVVTNPSIDRQLGAIRELGQRHRKLHSSTSSQLQHDQYNSTWQRSEILWVQGVGVVVKWSEDISRENR
jgi:hypothetical protein